MGQNAMSEKNNYVEISRPVVAAVAVTGEHPLWCPGPVLTGSLAECLLGVELRLSTIGDDCMMAIRHRHVYDANL